jgi:hypothetical protein
MLFLVFLREAGGRQYFSNHVFAFSYGHTNYGSAGRHNSIVQVEEGSATIPVSVNLAEADSCELFSDIGPYGTRVSACGHLEMFIFDIISFLLQDVRYVNHTITFYFRA